MEKFIEGIWRRDDVRRIFVAGAKWWEYESRGATMWNSDVRKAEKEAEARYPGGKSLSMKFNPYQWYWYQKKRGKHEEAIKEALASIELHKPKNPWAYGNKVVDIINGNYCERDHAIRHEAVKEEFTGFNEDVIDLIGGIGG